MKKAPEAFRTISEVADLLDTPAHVLRFWESKFYQIRPVKRAGGRRYYRPDDVALINGIRVLLQDRGMTIRGVQRILQEDGIKAVAATGLPLPVGGLPRDVTERVTGPDIAELPDDTLPEDAVLVDAGLLEAMAEDLLPEFTAPAAVRPEDTLPEDPVEPAAPDRGEDLAQTPAFDESGAEAAAPDPWREAAAALRAEPLALDDAQLAVGDNAGDVSPLPDSEPQAVVIAEPTPTPAAAVVEAARPLDQALPDEDLAMTQDLLTAPAPSVEPTDRSRIARGLRALPRHAQGLQRDRMALLARRIDALLERMSEASGAGRW